MKKLITIILAATILISTNAFCKEVLEKKKLQKNSISANKIDKKKSITKDWCNTKKNNIKSTCEEDCGKQMKPGVKGSNIQK